MSHTKKLILTLPRGAQRVTGTTTVTKLTAKNDKVTSTLSADGKTISLSNAKLTPNNSQINNNIKAKSNGSTEEVRQSETDDSDLEAFYGEEEENGPADAYLIYSFTGPKSVKVKTAAFTDVPEDGLPEEYLNETIMKDDNGEQNHLHMSADNQEMECDDDEEEEDDDEEEEEEDDENENSTEITDHENHTKSSTDPTSSSSTTTTTTTSSKKLLKISSTNSGGARRQRVAPAPVPVYGEAFWVGEEDKPLELKPPSPRTARYVSTVGPSAITSIRQGTTDASSIKVCGVNKSGQINPNIIFKCNTTGSSGNNNNNHHHHTHSNGILSNNNNTSTSANTNNTNVSRFISYRSSIASKTMRCHTCGRHYRNAYSLNHHICSPRKSVWRRGDVACHIIDGRQIYFCPICERPFKWLGNLTRHYYVHTGQRFFKCEICNKEFFSSYQVKRHMNSHTGLRYKCELCQKPFTCKYACAWHTRQHYTTTNSSTNLNSNNNNNNNNVAASVGAAGNGGGGGVGVHSSNNSAD